MAIPPILGICFSLKSLFPGWLKFLFMDENFNKKRENKVEKTPERIRAIIIPEVTMVLFSLYHSIGFETIIKCKGVLDGMFRALKIKTKSHS